MKNKTILFLFLFSLVISCDRCKKKDDPNIIDTTKLPPATTTGENTMGCLVNGEVWLPLKENFLGNLVYDVSFNLSGEGLLNIVGRKRIESIDETIFIFGGGVLIPENYEYSVNSSNFSEPFFCGTFDLDTTFQSNYFEITHLDWENHIISGIFEMRVIKENCDTLTITEGRFDLSDN